MENVGPQRRFVESSLNDKMRPGEDMDPDVQDRGHDKCEGLSPKEACRDTSGESEAPVAGAGDTRESTEKGGLGGEYGSRNSGRGNTKYKGLKATESNSEFQTK